MYSSKPALYPNILTINYLIVTLAYCETKPSSNSMQITHWSYLEEQWTKKSQYTRLHISYNETILNQNMCLQLACD